MCTRGMSGREKEREWYKIQVKNAGTKTWKDHHIPFPEKILSKLFSINKKPPSPNKGDGGGKTAVPLRFLSYPAKKRIAG